MGMSKIYCAHTDVVATDSLIENPRNPNRHPEDQIIALAKIIRHQGWRNPIVVSRRSGFVVKGHGRLLAARMLGLEEVPVDYQDYDNEAAEWADMVADNKIAELSNMDEDELNAIIRELDGQIDLELTGFSDSEINSMLSSVSEDLEAVPDNVPLDADNDSTVTILPFIAYGAKKIYMQPDEAEQQSQTETPNDAEIEAALWQEVEEAREAELAEELNEAVTDVEPTAEAPAQESIVEPTKPEAAEVVEIKLTTYNLKKAGQAPVSITPKSNDIKLEPGDQLIRIYKGKLIEVDVLDSSYKWNSEVYPTLTHISWKVTGYQIGGNNFFEISTKRRGE